MFSSRRNLPYPIMFSSHRNLPDTAPWAVRQCRPADRPAIPARTLDQYMKNFFYLCRMKLKENENA